MGGFGDGDAEILFSDERFELRERVGPAGGIGQAAGEPLALRGTWIGGGGVEIETGDGGWEMEVFEIGVEGAEELDGIGERFGKTDGAVDFPRAEQEGDVEF